MIKENKKEDEKNIIVVSDNTHKSLTQFKEKLNSKVPVALTFNSILSILVDCVDENKLNDKIKLIKEGVGL